MGADTKANTSGWWRRSNNWSAAAYPRVVICVSLRTAASAEAPSAPISLLLILRHG